MDAAPTEGRFEHLREHSIGLPQVLFQSITDLADGASGGIRWHTTDCHVTR